MHIAPLITDLAGESCRILEASTDLSPGNPAVTFTLGSLVAALGGCADCGAVDPLLQQRLPPLCGLAEGAMEKQWARALLAREALTAADLRLFWYYDHYLTLVEDELDLLEGAGIYPAHLVFLGSGALPLTAIMAAQAWPEIRITCVDMDAEANTLARALFTRLGLPIMVRTMAAQDMKLGPDDLPIMASLLSAKLDMFSQFKAQGVRNFMLRDAEGPYRLLYHPAPVPPAAQYAPIARTLLSAQRINTSILYGDAQ